MDQVGSRLWLWLRLWAGILLYMYSANAPLCCCSSSSSSSSSCCLKSALNSGEQRMRASGTSSLGALAGIIWGSMVVGVGVCG
jgi:hypothetical protein